MSHAANETVAAGAPAAETPVDARPAEQSSEAPDGPADGGFGQADGPLGGGGHGVAAGGHGTIIAHRGRPGPG